MNKLPVSLFYFLFLRNEKRIQTSLYYKFIDRKKAWADPEEGDRVRNPPGKLNWFLCGINNWTPSVKVGPSGTLENYI